ncbi:hypothetical protein Tco_1031802 [Tanacetum coccineum]|uniref:Integrase, catalytic region, zinc finger, CCHC-type, peptidase aspartic, catalytic n=1 Tax=Tanacetum coccineum TaxID=301880 RepID=A0ABQ5GAF7_9ASTR
MYRIPSTTTQTRTPQLPHASRNTNPHMSKSSGVIHTTSVSRPQLKSYQVKDKVVPNISQVKFTKKEVEDNHRISSISKKTKSVTACNDSSNSRTSNANAVCADCGKCVFNSDQDPSPILGYGDLIQGNVMIKRVYYVEGLNHNHFLPRFILGQFCDADLEVAFRKSTCFVRDLQGNDLLTGSRGSDLYTISLQETTSSTPICFMAKASPTQACSKLLTDPLPEQRPRILEQDPPIIYPRRSIEHQPSTPLTPEQNGVVERREPYLVECFLQKTDSSQQGLEFLFSPLIEEYYNPTHGQAEENNNDQAPNAIVYKKLNSSSSLCTPGTKIGESPLEQVRGNPTIASSNKTTACHRSERCYVLAHGYAQERVLYFERIICSQLLAWKPVRILLPTQHPKSFPTIRWTENWHFLKGPLKEEVMLLSQKGFVDPYHPEKCLPSTGKLCYD